MEEDNRAWNGKDSQHCWEALAALWFSKVFIDCLRKNSEFTEDNQETEVESVVLRWDGTTGEFGPWMDSDTING